MTEIPSHKSLSETHTSQPTKRLGDKIKKLLIGISVSVLCVASASYVVFDRTSYSTARSETFSVLAQSVAAGAYGPTAFGDAESAQYMMKTLDAEKYAIAASIYTSDGKQLTKWSGAAKNENFFAEEEKDQPSDKSAVFTTLALDHEQQDQKQDVLLVKTPIKNAEGQVGSLYVVFSTEDIKERTQMFAGMAVLIILGSVGAAFVLGNHMQKRITAPVQDLLQTTDRVREQNDFAVRARISSDDEFALLAGAVNDMLDGLQKRDVELAEYRNNLEKTVELRTAQLSTRNEKMRAILDNVEQGFATILADGSLAEERSAQFDRWFEYPEAKKPIHEVFGQVDAKAGVWFSLGFESILDGFLPIELCIEQLPKRMSKTTPSGVLTFGVEYLPNDDGSLLLVVTDITESLLREQAEAEQRDFTTLFTRFWQDRSSVVDFLAEIDRLLGLLPKKGEEHHANVVELKRTIHTLKGNSAIFGLSKLATACHEIENRLQEQEQRGEKAVLQPEDRQHLCDLLERSTGKIRAVVDMQRSSLSVSRDEHANALQALSAGDADMAYAMLLRWQEESATQRLQGLADQARALAERMEKGNIHIEVEGNNIFLPADHFSSMWSSLVHGIRNTVDHGIDSSEARALRGVHAPATIQLHTHIQRHQDGKPWLHLCIRDNGRGVQWARVAEKAKAAGLPYTTQHDLHEAIFSDGFSTRDEASEISGRGVGMSAVRAAAEALGGTCYLNSVEGQGTALWIHAPLPVDCSAARSFGAWSAAAHNDDQHAERGGQSERAA